MTTRRRRLMLIAALIALLAVWYAAAQGLPPDVDPAKPATWFLTASGWGGLVLLAINFLKTNVFKGLHGSRTIFVAAAINLLGPLIASTGILSSFGVNLDATVAEAISFGVTAFITSVGFYDTATQTTARAIEIAERRLTAGGKK